MYYYVILTYQNCIYNTYVLKFGVSFMAIDYSYIGQRIKQKRSEKGLTQEQLAEKIGIGASHMSHLEGGKTVASMDVFIAMCNALECSADELLCKEVTVARPIVDHWLVELVEDCDRTEIKIISDTVAALKQTLRKNKTTE